MSQSRVHSLIEAWANVGVGFVLSWLTNIIVLPLWGFHVSALASLQITLVFTVVSLIRSYVLRRVFNRWHLRMYEQG